MAADLSHIVDIYLTNDEWRDVVRRLTAAACALLPADRAVKGLGDGPTDLVQETIRRLFDPETKVKWRSEFGKPTVPKVSGFLAKVLRNYFLDRLKTGTYRYTAPDPVLEDRGEDEDGSAAGMGSVAIPSVEEQPVTRMYIRQLYTRARQMAETEGDVEVVFYLDLQFQDGGPYKNAEAAKELGLHATDIVNIRKRIDRLLVRAGRDEPDRPDRGRE